MWGTLLILPVRYINWTDTRKQEIMWFRLWALLGFFAMAGGFVALFMDGNLLSLNPAIVAIQTAAVALVVSARRYLGLRSFHAGAKPTRGALVTDGPYRVIRHPIYTGACLFVWPPAVSCHTLPAFTLTALVTVGAVIVCIWTNIQVFTDTICIGIHTYIRIAACQLCH